VNPHIAIQKSVRERMHEPFWKSPTDAFQPREVKKDPTLARLDGRHHGHQADGEQSRQRVLHSEVVKAGGDE
jgi:hypothetical protein